ncbi:MAG TPA: alpha/beta fold hydrolase [Thermoanaerobaculia bacterium]|nr:alpha/beta fold hydrolase [Thermoanaerobaculia bacterium]
MLTLLLAAALVAGPHPVGYRAEVVRDATRADRAIYVQAWYPARPAVDAKPLLYGQYVDGYEARRATTLEIHQYAAKKYGAPADAPQKLFASTTNAFKDAPAGVGSFPLIVYGGGAGNVTDENATLAEYLASHGFVFVSVPAMGASSNAITLDAAGLETQTRDLEVARDYARRIANADQQRVIAGGFSWGGASAIAFANRQPDVRAVFMLDSSTTSKRYGSFVAGAPFFDIARFTMPVLDLHRQDEAVTYDVLDRYRYAERFSFEMREPNHIDFNAMPLLYAKDSDRARGYEWIARTVLTFVQGSREWPATSAYQVTLRHRAAMPAPPTPAELEALARKDPAAATRAYQQHASVYAPETINRIGYALLTDDAAAAREVFLWNVRAHPQNADWLDSLGDALLKTNERDCARAVFARVAAISDSPGLRDRANREVAALANATQPCKYLEALKTP